MKSRYPVYRVWVLVPVEIEANSSSDAEARVKKLIAQEYLADSLQPISDEDRERLCGMQQVGLAGKKERGQKRARPVTPARRTT